ncbi:MAG: hypothetical protein AAFN30_02860 [Actinomycetota bacterium]
MPPPETTGGAALPDGRYDVMVIDATDDGDGRCVLSLAISTGLAKGEVVDLGVDGIDIDPLELLGLPGVVEVEAGTPRFLLA